MASIVPGYEYDIFISYRQKDNKGDMWVSEFVAALKTELESTFKEEISVYFDINPHDGLLQTHDVDASLKDKLKCLVFIPIISRTYCDPRSFAWTHEFKVFVEQASMDRFGLKVKLSKGNVTNRILPIQIHDLTSEDKALLEEELGGVLRSIDFIYLEPGVNRPLTPEDDEKTNLNNTRYRNQINKVANAIDEIFRGLKSTTTGAVEEKSRQIGLLKEIDKEEKLKKQESPAKFNKSKYLLPVSILALILVTAIFVYPKLFNSDKHGNSAVKESVKKSVAVLPFKLLSDEPDKQYLADGIMDAILLHLSKIKELRVMSRTSVEQYRGTTKTTRQIGKELDVEYLLEGSFQKYGEEAKLIVQLIKANEESQIWGDAYDRNWKDIFSVQSEVAQTIARELNAVITPEEKQIMEKTPTKDLEAYDAFLKGQFFYEMFSDDRTEEAIIWFKESIRLDSVYALPWTYLSMCYWRLAATADTPQFKESKLAAEKALELDPASATAIVNMGEILDNEYDFKGAEEKIKLALKTDPDNSYVLRNVGRFYTKLGRGDESISFCNRALQVDPLNRTALSYLALAYFYAGNFTKTRETMKISEDLGYSRSRRLDYMLLLEEGKLEEIVKEQGVEENDISHNIAMAAVDFKQGRKDEGENICGWLMKQKITDFAYWIAFTHAYGDEPEKVYIWLERSFAAKEKQFTYVGVDPAFEKFRNEPRVKRLLEKMGFPI